MASTAAMTPGAVPSPGVSHADSIMDRIPARWRRRMRMAWPPAKWVLSAVALIYLLPYMRESPAGFVSLFALVFFVFGPIAAFRETRTAGRIRDDTVHADDRAVARRILARHPANMNTAMHEAGHVVAALRCGVRIGRIRSVTIGANGDGLTRIDPLPVGSDNRRDMECVARAMLDVLLAGSAVDELTGASVCGGSSDMGLTSAYVDRIIALNPDADTREQVLRDEMDRTRALVAENMDDIEWLGERICGVATWSGDYVLAALDGSLE